MGNELFDLTGRTALITGGSRGIGFALTTGLAQNGADVAIIARNEEQLKKAKEQIQNQAGKKVWTYCFDLENSKAIEGLFEKIVTDTAGIDILVNSAGLNLRAPAEDIDLAVWQRTINVNLTAVLVMSQAFCRHRKNLAKAGKIINIGSLQCRGARPTTTAYAASKGGITMLTKSLAVEWAKYNINVNAIGPGYIETELTAKLKDDIEFNKWVLSKTPLDRWGQPADLIGAAVFLASNASDFVTGQMIFVDGGWLAAL